MTDFEKIKQFFVEHTDKFVHYKIIDKEEKSKEGYLSDFIHKQILNNPKVKDFFAIEFPFNCDDKSLVTIDSLDSFVFDFYFLDLDNKIIITDAERTFQCGVEAYEGNGVLADKYDIVKKYLAKNNIEDGDFAISKVTTLDTFVQDTITFIKVLQTLNNIQPFPPYLLELDSAKEVVDVLTRTWVNSEKITDGKSSRKLALFDNHKRLMENQSCPEKSYPAFHNKHAFVSVFFNEEDKVLICKNLKGKKPQYDFAITDYVAEDEWYSLEALQRAIKENFGFEFWFGEVAPALTTVKDKIITDYYIIKNYNVSIEELTYDNQKIAYDWVSKDELIALVKSGDFGSYTKAFIEYVYETKDNM